MKPVRLYGCFIGHASAATVTEGWRKALLHHELLHDVFTFAGSEFETLPDGFNTPIAVVTDVRELGNALASPHEQVHVVLALHSDWVPPVLYSMLRDKRITVLVPSEDTKRHLLAAMKEVAPRIEVVEHGVDEGFRPLTKEQNEALPKSSLGNFFCVPDAYNFIHFCESSIERKGTLELIEAFDRFCADVEPNAMLTIIPSPLQTGPVHRAIAGRRGMRTTPRLNAPAEKLRFVYSCFDAIVQPSRAEGFGLVPLEGLCVGVPCLITRGNGHDQWALVEGAQGTSIPRLGVRTIDLSDPGPPEIEPAPVPTVDDADIEEGLHRLMLSLLTISVETKLGTENLRARYAWESVTRSWADKIKETFG